jgi:hypothetical protein
MHVMAMTEIMRDAAQEEAARIRAEVEGKGHSLSTSLLPRV